MVVMLAAASRFAMASEASSGWRSIPTQQELLASYPPAAIHDHFGGEVEMVCGHDLAGALTNCHVTRETPAGAGFGAAALSLVPRFQIDMATTAGRRSQVTIPLLFASVGASPPVRSALFRKSNLTPAGPYWPEDALRAGVGGSATIDCKVASNDQLKDCRIVTERPIGFNFIFAALKMAERGWMTASPPPPGEAPVDGFWRFEVVYPPRNLP